MGKQQVGPPERTPLSGPSVPLAPPDFRALFESAPGLYLVLTPPLHIVAVTDAYLEATLTRREDILGRHLFDVFPDNPQDPAATGVRNLRASLERVLRHRARDTMAVQKYDIRRPESEGGGFEERYWSPTNSPVLGKDGEVAYLIHRVEDVTDFVRLQEQHSEDQDAREALTRRVQEMQAEVFLARELQAASQKLRESEAGYRTLADAIPQIIWTAGPDGRIDSLNQRWADYTGHPRDEALEQGWHRFLPPEDARASEEAWAEAQRTGRPYQTEHRIRGADGAYRWFLVRALPLKDEHGRVIRWFGSSTDIEEQKRAEAEREALLAQTRARAEREALVNRIARAIRGTTDPALIQEEAVALLGEALGADRCYFVTYDFARDSILVGRDYRRPDLPSLEGRYHASEFEVLLGQLFGGGTAVIPDVRTAAALSPETVPVMEGFGLRAVLAVPFFDGGQLVAALFAAMAGGPRAWAEGDVTLMEAAATLVRTSVESAKVALREKTIATQLQAALQPEPPRAVPGLALRGYYRPALEEASVGGDFYDVFALDEGRTALVVGDLSGKGLAAAAQVATVRNMLRAVLYQPGTLAAAVTRLNDMLTGHRLLTSFVTLFVGAYDSASRTLTYVNCGQEPGLVRRAAAGAVEELPSTGPVLGTLAGESFDERAVPLSPGDALALFTDGLTEVGPTRSALLGVAGVTALLEPPPAERDALSAERAAESLTRRLVAGVDAHAKGGASDDMCLLVGVVGDGGRAEHQR